MLTSYIFPFKSRNLENKYFLRYLRPLCLNKISNEKMQCYLLCAGCDEFRVTNVIQQLDKEMMIDESLYYRCTQFCKVQWKLRYEFYHVGPNYQIVII